MKFTFFWDMMYDWKGDDFTTGFRIDFCVERKTTHNKIE